MRGKYVECGIYIKLLTALIHVYILLEVLDKSLRNFYLDIYVWVVYRLSEMLSITNDYRQIQ